MINLLINSENVGKRVELSSLMLLNVIYCEVEVIDRSNTRFPLGSRFTESYALPLQVMFLTYLIYNPLILLISLKLHHFLKPIRKFAHVFLSPKLAPHTLPWHRIENNSNI